MTHDINMMPCDIWPPAPPGSWTPFTHAAATHRPAAVLSSPPPPPHRNLGYSQSARTPTSQATTTIGFHLPTQDYPPARHQPHSPISVSLLLQLIPLILWIFLLFFLHHVLLLCANLGLWDICTLKFLTLDNLNCQIFIQTLETT